MIPKAINRLANNTNVSLPKPVTTRVSCAVPAALPVGGTVVTPVMF